MASSFDAEARLSAGVVLWAAVTAVSFSSALFDPPPAILAIASVGISAVASIGLVLDRDGQHHDAWHGMLAVWIATLPWLACVTLPDALVVPQWAPDGHVLCMCAPVAGGIAACASFYASRGARSWVGRARPSAVIAFAAVGLLASSALVLSGHRGPRLQAPHDQLAALRPDLVVAEVDPLEDEQRVAIGPDVELARTCDVGSCSVRLVSAGHPHPIVTDSDSVDRGELEIVSLARAIVVVQRPRDEEITFEWDPIHRIAFDARTLDQRELLVSDPPDPSAAPQSWSTAAVVALAFAWLALGAAVRTARRARDLARFVEAIVEPGGRMRIAEGIARCDRDLPVGPALVVVDRAQPSYRADALVVVREALTGTRAEHRARIERRAAGLAAGALLVAIAAAVPLLAARWEGLVVLAPW